MLNVTKMLLTSCRKFNWNKSNGNLAVIYIHVIDMLSVMAQEEYPYHVEGGKKWFTLKQKNTSKSTYLNIFFLCYANFSLIYF